MFCYFVYYISIYINILVLRKFHKTSMLLSMMLYEQPLIQQLLFIPINI